VTDPDLKTYLELVDRAIAAIIVDGQDPKEYGKTADAKPIVDALERLEAKYPDDKGYFEGAPVSGEAFVGLSQTTLRFAALGITMALQQYLEHTDRLEKE
jgi:hypothetical protein